MGGRDEVGDWGCRVWVRRDVGQICVLEGSLWLERRAQDQGGGCGEGEAGMGLGLNLCDVLTNHGGRAGYHQLSGFCHGPRTA